MYSEDYQIRPKVQPCILQKENKLLFRLCDFPRDPNHNLFMDVLRSTVSLLLRLLCGWCFSKHLICCSGPSINT